MQGFLAPCLCWVPHLRFGGMGISPQPARGFAFPPMTKPMSLPWYPWYVTLYRANRKVRRLTYVERGLYRELLDECWDDGSIPDDVPKLAEIAGCPVGVMAEAWPNLRPLFEPSEGLDGMYLQSPRLEQIREAQNAFRAKQSQRRKGTTVNHGQPRLTIESREEKRKEEKANGPLVTQAAELPPPTTRPPRKAEDWRKLLEKSDR